MAPGATSKFGAPMFEPELFRKQIHYIEEGTCDIFGTFRSPCSDSAPPYWFGARGIDLPLTPSFTPDNRAFVEVQGYTHLLMFCCQIEFHRTSTRYCRVYYFVLVSPQFWRRRSKSGACFRFYVPLLTSYCHYVFKISYLICRGCGT